MAKRNAPAGLTGGQGFNYEDQVAAHFLLGLLGGPHPLGPDLGPPARVGWQAAESGWRLDDLALTFGTGDHERCAGVSIKNHKHVTEGGFDDAFTRDCWEQWLGVGTARRFRTDRDLLVLVTGALAGGVRAAWDHLLGQAVELAAAPDRLAARMWPAAGAGAQASETQRALFASLRCPPGLRPGPPPNDAATATLARHVRLVHLDFEGVPSRASTGAVAGCRAALRAGTADDARALWDALVRIAARKRGHRRPALGRP